MTSFLSVCSGIEAASVAWLPLGWAPVGFSEIDAFPSALLALHYPDVPNFGDLNAHTNWPILRPDVVVGGTPCQSFSVAGKRGGLDDPRGRLMFAFLGVVERQQPRWVVWENVPGVLSSNGGRDFGALLGALGDMGYGWAFRVLDAQWFGVPQRRRRVFVVAHIGAEPRRAGAVLFESESVRRDSSPSRSPREDDTGSTGDGLARCLMAGESRRQDLDTCNFVDDSPSPPLTVSRGGTPDPLRGAMVACFVQNSRSEVRYVGGDGQVTGVLAADHGAQQQNYMVASVPPGQSRSESRIVECDRSTTLTAGESRKPESGIRVTDGTRVRRLTVTECERLQGFPDGYTGIPYRGKRVASDSPRIKALGNSMAVPVIRWIGQRMARVDASRRLP